MIGEMGGDGVGLDMVWQKKAMEYFPTQDIGAVYFARGSLYIYMCLESLLPAWLWRARVWLVFAWPAFVFVCLPACLFVCLSDRLSVVLAVRLLKGRKPFRLSVLMYWNVCQVCFTSV